MIIIGGALYVEPSDRAGYLTAAGPVVAAARSAAGCLDFVQVADPLADSRIDVYERWESDADVDAFRAAGPPLDMPRLRGADVRKYRVAGVETP